jgi:CIC family chloride channel protein
MRHRISFMLWGKGNSLAVLDYRAVRVTIAAILAGLMIGAVGGAFRLLLGKADDVRYTLVVWAHAWPYLGWLAPVALGTVGAALARLMVARFAPEDEGSGIQRVEALFAGEIKPGSPPIDLAIKFFGGLLSIGSGLALGREGPTVHMGVALSALASRLIKHEEDRRVIGAAGAGAGLAVAFNAPIGGSVFVFEELTSSFTPWLLLATLAATTFAVWTMGLIFGNHFDFTIRQVSLTAEWKGWPFFGLGVLLGAGGALYNSAIIGLLCLCDRFVRISSVLRAALIGGVVGLLAWFAPAMVGGGDKLTQAVLTQRFPIAALVGIFLLRFAVGPWSYAAGCPGGLFAPMLVVGASFGAFFGEVLNGLLPALGVTPFACAVVGMATLFTACVRAPLTGIVLAVEMTGRGDLMLPLLSASLMAMLTTMLLDTEPIYETLKRRMIERQAKIPTDRGGPKMDLSLSTRKTS